VASDTTLTAKSDTAAYFVLDTVNINLYTYKASATGRKWIQLGSDTTSLNLVSRFAAKLNISDTASMLTNYYRSGRALGTPTSGVLSNATGLPIGTGLTGLGAANRIPYASSTTALTTSSDLAFNGTALFVQNIRINKGNLNQDASMAIGYQALDSTISPAEQNMAIGYQSQFGLKTGAYNVSQGFQALYFNKSSNYNAAFGYRSLFQTTSERNTGVAPESLYNNTSGGYNVGIGFQAGYYNTTGNENVFIGNRSAWASPQGNSNTTGSNNIIIGSQAVGASATASNVITLGNSSIATLRCNATLSGLSDIRDKTNIMPLNYGIDFIKKLNPVSFDWDMRDGGKIGISEIGFIAQELQQAQIDYGVNIPNLVYDINPDKLEASYGVLIPIMVKALKEQQALIDELKQRILNLENK
jgi:hypothetical protein